MSNVPLTGQISLGSMRTMMGKSTSSPIGMRDCYGYDAGSPLGGNIALSIMRGANSFPDLYTSFNPDAQSNCVGIYSTTLVNKSYTGPLMNVRRSLDSATINVFGDNRENLRVATGVTLSNWMSGSATVEVLTWFDQSTRSNNATTTGTGRNPPRLIFDTVETERIVVSYPNTNATAAAYFGFSLPSVAVASAICSFRPESKTDQIQSLICTNTANEGIRFISGSLQHFDIRDFLRTSIANSFAIMNGVYDATTPYASITNGTWHNLCAVRGDASTLTMIHLGNCEPTFSSGTLMPGSFNGAMRSMILFNSNLPTTTVGSETTVPEYNNVVSSTLRNPFRSGVTACYLADNWNGTQWNDASGNGNHVTNVSGTVTKTTSSNLFGVGGQPILTGTTSTNMTFPMTLNSNYTMLHIARYNNSTNQERIITALDTSGINWLSGHWDGNTGVSYQLSWLTPEPQVNRHGRNWVLSHDVRNAYRSQGVLRGTVANGVSPTSISINKWDIIENSDWAMAYMCTFNRVISSTETLVAEESLALRYRIPIPISNGLILHLNANDHIGGGTTWVDRSGNSHDFTMSESISFNAGSFTTPACMEPFFNYSRVSAVPFAKYCTMVTWVTPIPSKVNWRTLIKGVPLDHYLLIEAGGHRLGYFDNTAGVFIPYDTTVDVNTLPNAYSRMNMWVAVFSTVAPFVTFYYNPSSLPLTPTGMIASNTNAVLKNGLGYVNTLGRQYFGRMGTMLWYNRRLGNEEIVELYRRYENLYINSTQPSQINMTYLIPKLWIRVDELSGLSSGTAVTSWTGMANGVNAIGVGIGMSAPVYTVSGNERFVRFGNGTSSTTIGNYFHFGTQTFNMATKEGCTVFAVVRFGTVSSWERVIDFGDGAPNNNIILGRFGSTSNLFFQLYNGVTEAGINTQNSVIGNNWMVVVCRLFPNEVLLTTTSTLNKTFPTYTLNNRTFGNTYVGRSNWPDAYANFDLRELVIYDRVMEDDELLIVRAILLSKYNLQIPSGDPLAFSFILMPGGARTLLNYIQGFGVNQSSSNTGTGSWLTSFSGDIPFISSPIANTVYFTNRGRVRIIDGDGTNTANDWAMFNFGVANGNGDFNFQGQSFFGGASTRSGGNGGLGLTTGQIWGFSTTNNWVLLYQLPVTAAVSTFARTNANWFSSGGTVASGDGKRSAYDTESIILLGFTVV
jgi:hypothetical protein